MTLGIKICRFVQFQIQIQMINTSKQQFKRKLKTNYNYSILVTLSMNLARMHCLYQIINRIAERNEIKTQKNYSIVVLRLALLMREKMLKVQDIFGYLKTQYKKCVRKKYQYSLSQAQIIAIEASCLSNIEIFKNGLSSGIADEKQASSIFIKLYDDGQKPKQRHIKWATHLARIWVQVMQNKECYMILPKDLENLSSGSKSQKMIQMSKTDEINSQDSELVDLVSKISMIDLQGRTHPELKDFILFGLQQSCQYQKQLENPELKQDESFLN